MLHSDKYMEHPYIGLHFVYILEASIRASGSFRVLYGLIFVTIKLHEDLDSELNSKLLFTLT